MRSDLITFTYDEINATINCAQQRRRNLDSNDISIGRAATNDITKDFCGVLSELAVAKYFGVQYLFTTDWQAGRFDVCNGVEVRSTRHQRGNLIVYTYDIPAPYVLTIVNSKPITVKIVGWRDLVDCRLEKYWRTTPAVKKDSYWIPQKDLHSMQSLKEKLALV